MSEYLAGPGSFTAGGREAVGIVACAQPIRDAEAESADDSKADGDHPGDEQMRPQYWQHEPDGHQTDTGIRDEVVDFPAIVSRHALARHGATH